MTHLTLLWLFRLHQWNEQEEGTALPEFAFHPYFSSMSFGYGFDDGESKSGAALRQRFAVCATIKLFEQPREITFGDSNSAVLNRECSMWKMCIANVWLLHRHSACTSTRFRRGYKPPDAGAPDRLP